MIHTPLKISKIIQLSGYQKLKFFSDFSTLSSARCSLGARSKLGIVWPSTCSCSLVLMFLPLKASLKNMANFEAFL